MPERATELSWSEKSAEAVVLGGGAGEAESRRGRAERAGVPKAVLLGGAVHQKPAQAGRIGEGRGEAVPETVRDEARTAQHVAGSSGRDDLLAQALAAANRVRAWKRVKSNRGSAGVDGRSIAETTAYLRTHWPRIREALLDGSDRPEPVRRVRIPKSGGGVRERGIPTVTDRLIQQALLQVLQPLIDPMFSEHSDGFRPGRRAQDAVLDAQRCVQDGDRVVVDVDLETFFDRVNHDILMERLARRIADKAVLRLIRGYLVAGIRDGGGVWSGMRARRKAGPCRRSWPMCCSTRGIGNWSGAAIGWCATPTTATSTCAVAVRANEC